MQNLLRKVYEKILLLTPAIFRGDYPPTWTLLAENNNKSGNWPIKDQIKAFHNLLGKFKLFTQHSTSGLDGWNNKFKGNLIFNIRPMYLPEKYRVRIELYSQNGDARKVLGYAVYEFPDKTVSFIQKFTDPKFYICNSDSKSYIIPLAFRADLDFEDTTIYTRVGIHFYDPGNTIICEQKVFEDNLFFDHYDNEGESEIFE